MEDSIRISITPWYVLSDFLQPLTVVMRQIIAEVQKMFVMTVADRYPSCKLMIWSVTRTEGLNRMHRQT